MEAGIHHLIGKPEGARNKWNDGKLGSEDLLVSGFENIKTKHTKALQGNAQMKIEFSL